MRQIIIGKSKAALSMIFDAICSHTIRMDRQVIVLNNLNIEGEIKHMDFHVKEIHLLEEIELLGDDMIFLGAVMPQTKRKIVEAFPLKYSKGTNRWTSVHNWGNIGEGTFVDANVTIAGSAKVGKYVTVYCNSSINHDSIIGDFVTICPNVAVCGGVEIGEGSFIGAGAVIKNGVSIGENAVIGCGSVVINDVPDGQIIYGSPAKNKSQWHKEFTG